LEHLAIADPIGKPQNINDPGQFGQHKAISHNYIT
jgi:hypothetical protein